VIAIENVRLFDEVQARTRDLTESLQQQTATTDVLKVISSSPGELEPVFNAMLENATRLCEASYGNLLLREGDAFRMAAVHGDLPALVLEKWRPGNLFRPNPEVPIARAARTGKVVQVADLREDLAYLNGDPLPVLAVDVAGARTLIAIPMLKEGELVGAIVIYRQEVRPFTEKQIELVSNFAAQAVIAIENTRLLSELRESLAQQTAAADVLEVISRSAFDLQPVFESVAKNSVRLCEADHAVVFRFDGELLRVVAGFNTAPGFMKWIEQNPIRPGRHSGAARAALERRTIHIPDVLADPEYSYGAKNVEAIRTILGVPILKGDDLLGVIMIFRLEVRAFTEKQIALVETFADQAAIAIENVRLFEEVQSSTRELSKSVDELRALGEVSQAVNSTLDLENVLSTIVAKAVQLSGTEAGAIYVFDEMQREFNLRATYGMDQALINALASQHIGLNEPNVALAFAQSEPTQVADLRQEASSELNEITLRAGYRARLVAPLTRGGDVVGILVVRRRTAGQFEKSTVDLIKTFAAQSALAIQNARLFENVETRTRELAKSLDDLRAAQDRLVQTEKLASLGQLTAGIAHEIKNPLNFVNNFSGISAELIDELQDVLKGISINHKARTEINELTDTLRGNLDKVVQHGKRADAIVKNMLLHSRQGSGEHRPVDINSLVEESLNLAYHGARAEKQGFNITLERSFDPTAGEVDLFPQEITRVLLNLISNGFYASTKRKAEANGGNYEPTLAAVTKNLGDRVEIRIRDNGTGIPPEVKEKMFNPFFTTKPAGEGTGLGLSISHDIIVKQHGGSIEVDTKPGEFTEFRIVLPRTGASLIKSGGRASH
jgi:two-component system, NtrC family, sensor kinase